jgi:aminopeptidase
MSDPRIDQLADVLVNYSIGVHQEDKVLINGSTLAAPLLKAIYIKTLQAGGLPLMMVSLPDIDSLLYQYATNEQLQHIPPPTQLIYETYDAFIQIGSADNTKSLSGVVPAKMVLRNRAQRDLMKTFMQRSAIGQLRWMASLFPTNAYAQDAEMNLSQYEDFVFGACLPDTNDPVNYWKQFSIWQQKIVDWLKGKNQVRVIGPETDLTLSIAGRTFINCDGHFNMPDGEIFTGPVENSLSGHVYFSYPAIQQGREVTGVRLWFENGKVVKSIANKNEDYLTQTLDTDEGSRFVGEFAIGTNEGIQRFSRQILFDEKIGGSFHLALGAGYPETGSHNQSAIHWDMICDLRQGGEIWVDEVLLYKDGKFVLAF